MDFPFVTEVKHATSVMVEKIMSDLERNRKTAVAFFTPAFNDHEPDDVVAKHVGSQYIQHNPDTPDGGIHRKYKETD